MSFQSGGRGTKRGREERTIINITDGESEEEDTATDAAIEEGTHPHLEQKYLW